MKKKEWGTAEDIYNERERENMKKKERETDRETERERERARFSPTRHLAAPFS